jgi:hypothetical protein
MVMAIAPRLASTSIGSCRREGRVTNGWTGLNRLAESEGENIEILGDLLEADEDEEEDD